MKLTTIYRFLGCEPQTELPPTLQQVSDAAVVLALIESRGNISQAATALGCGRDRIEALLATNAASRRRAIGMELPPLSLNSQPATLN
jgi:hypothetical protein